MKKIVLIVITLLVAVFIFLNSAKTAAISSSMSGGVIDWIYSCFGISLSQFTVRKLAHYTEFALLGASVYACISCFVRTDSRKLIATMTSGGVFAATDELHQIFVPGRSCEFRDWLIDFCGILLGIGVSAVIIKLSAAGKKV